MSLLDKDTGIWLLLQVNTKGTGERKNYKRHRTSIPLPGVWLTLGNLNTQEAEARELRAQGQAGPQKKTLLQGQKDAYLHLGS